MTSALIRSIICHSVLVLIVGCAVHKPIGIVPLADPELAEARDYLFRVAEKMPAWDADEKFAVLEQTEIANVKSDILMAYSERNDRDKFMEDIALLRVDADSLLALDRLLHHEYVM